MLVENTEITIEGRFIKTALVRYSWAEEIGDPSLFAERLKARHIKADIFTFWQQLHHPTPPLYNYYKEWDNFAVLPITSYDHWFRKQIAKQSRMKVKKASREGVSVSLVEFNDQLVNEITAIYNETSIRQGKPYLHYGKDFTRIKNLLSPRLDSSNFLGAYYNSELIGFIKLLFIGGIARTVTILSKVDHRDKAPNNALLAKAVEICEKRQIPFLIYGSFDYGKRGSQSLADFKRHHGFEKVDVPKYYIPLTTKGQLILKLRLHHGLIELLPRGLITHLISLRNKWYFRKNTNQ